jgi:hypothetical protein
MISAGHSFQGHLTICESLATLTAVTWFATLPGLERLALTLSTLISYLRATLLRSLLRCLGL